MHLLRSLNVFLLRFDCIIFSNVWHSESDGEVNSVCESESEGEREGERVSESERERERERGGEGERETKMAKR